MHFSGFFPSSLIVVCVIISLSHTCSRSVTEHTTTDTCSFATGTQCRVSSEVGKSMNSQFLKLPDCTDFEHWRHQTLAVSPKSLPLPSCVVSHLTNLCYTIPWERVRQRTTTAHMPTGVCGAQQDLGRGVALQYNTRLSSSRPKVCLCSQTGFSD